MNIAKFCAWILAASLVSASSAQAQATCPNYLAEIEEALVPSVGTHALVDDFLDGIDAWTGDGLSQRFDTRAAAAALGDRLRAARDCPRKKERDADPTSFECEFASRQDDSTHLYVDMTEGSIAYQNPQRTHDPDGPEHAVPAEEAIEVARRTAEGLGAPAAELHLDKARAKAIRRVTARVDQSEPATNQRVGVLALIGRRVNDYPIFQDGIQVAVDDQGRPARVQMRWADFSLGAVSNVRQRGDVVAEIAQFLGEIGNCQQFRDVVAQVGWVAVPSSDQSDEDGSAEAGRYVPGLRVAALPRLRPQGSGEVSGPVRILYVTLAKGAPSDG